MGVGHELRGDDAVGLIVARKLKRLLAYQVHILVIEAGAAPENATAPLRKFAPDLVLLVDAAQFNETPGTVRMLSWEQTTGLSACTHMLPPHMIARFLHTELGCEVALLGIQPAHTTLCAGLSPTIRTAVDGVVKLLLSLLVE